MAEFISQEVFASTTPRTLERTAFVESFDGQIRGSILAYFASDLRGTQVTLRVLDDLGESQVKALAEASVRTFGEAKQCIGLRVPILLVRMFGAGHVATYRDPVSKKASTRSCSANWPNLKWVSRYTPHQLSEAARGQVQTLLTSVDRV